MKPLQVWGWSDWENNSTPTREVMAAHSKAEVARAAGVKSPERLWNLGVTHNEAEIQQAMSAPGQVFWYPRIERDRQPLRWRHRLAPTKYGPGKQ
jgi:hypothetical protein